MHPDAYTYDEQQIEKASRDGAMSALDVELERLNTALESLGKRLNPVLARRDEDSVPDSHVRPLASSELRERVERLARTTAIVDRLIRDIDL
jgi:hypothetical protein